MKPSTKAAFERLAGQIDDERKEMIAARRKEQESVRKDFMPQESLEDAEESRDSRVSDRSKSK